MTPPQVDNLGRSVPVPPRMTAATRLGRRRVGIFQRLAFLASNPLFIFGAALNVSSAIVMMATWLFPSLGGRGPYGGILLLVALPALFVVGLILMPLGLYLRRRRLRRAGVLPSEYPHINLASPQVRRAFLLLFIATLGNLLILTLAVAHGREYMESNDFCGQACHSVMHPEATAFREGPHSGSQCVACHVAPGARGFLKAKLQGVHQLRAVTANSYPRPIFADPVKLVPADQTCVRCHNPQRFRGDALRVFTTYNTDEGNTPSVSVLLLRLGGTDPYGTASGIHGYHAGGRVSYLEVEGLDEIPRVKSRSHEGTIEEYLLSESKATPEQIQRGKWRVLDCTDCHNRIGHDFPSAEEGVDRALAQGRISRSLPYIRARAVEALASMAPGEEGGPSAARAADALTAAYRKAAQEPPQAEKAETKAAIAEIRRIAGNSLFPSLKVGWGTYPRNMGHADGKGCFRCHDEMHATASGKTIRQDCELCHRVLAAGESNPQLLEQLGIASQAEAGGGGGPDQPTK